LEVWRRSRILVREINRITAQPPLARDFGLRDQMRRAALSVMSNIAEGFESNSPKVFIRYLRIAKASLAEVRKR
jgi:four helix bundle protein